MNRQRHTANSRMNDQHLDELLAHARRRAWSGPDHSPRVDQHLKGITMKPHPRFSLSRSAVILLGLGAVAGVSLGAAVTHNLLSRRAILVTDDGTRYEVELRESPDGASGRFVAEDGSVFGIEMTEQGSVQHVTVDVNSPAGGTSTVILDNGMAPSVLTEPGQDARIEIRPAPTKPDADEG